MPCNDAPTLLNCVEPCKLSCKLKQLTPAGYSCGTRDGKGTPMGLQLSPPCLALRLNSTGQWTRSGHLGHRQKTTVCTIRHESAAGAVLPDVTKSRLDLAARLQLSGQLTQCTTVLLHRHSCGGFQPVFQQLQPWSLLPCKHAPAPRMNLTTD